MPTKDTLFRMTRQETKADATTRVAREIIQSEAEARQTKTAALRAARLEKAAVDEAAPEAATSTGSKAPAPKA